MKPTHSIEAYIQEVQNNIRWKRARKIATQDLEQHIQDQFDAYVNQGMDSDLALEEAIKSMGDPQKIGKELDCAYRPKINILLIELTTAFLVLGVIIHYLLEGTLSKNNFIAIGIGCFAAVALYFFDYTFLLRHPLAIYTVHLFFSACLFAFEARNGIHCIGYNYTFYTFVNCRLLVDSSGGVTAVVDMSVGAVCFIKIFVCGLRPVFSPSDKLLVAVPTCSD